MHPTQEPVYFIYGNRPEYSSNINNISFGCRCIRLDEAKACLQAECYVSIITTLGERNVKAKWIPVECFSCQI